MQHRYRSWTMKCKGSMKLSIGYMEVSKKMMIRKITNSQS